MPDFRFSRDEEALRERAQDVRERAVLPFLRARGSTGRSRARRCGRCSS